MNKTKKHKSRSTVGDKTNKCESRSSRRNQKGVSLGKLER